MLLIEYAKSIMSIESEATDFWSALRYPDVNGKFRFFNFENRDYVLKKIDHSSEYSEYRNLMRAYHLFRDMGLADELTPIVSELISEGDQVWLLSSHVGNTLEEAIEQNAYSFDEELFLGLLGRLFKAGLCWEGFAPRNILIDPSTKKMCAIDFEDFSFSAHSLKTVTDLHLMKLGLNWAILFAGDPHRAITRIVERLRLHIKVAPLDSFEEFFRLVSKKNITTQRIREIANDLTFQAERSILIMGRQSNLPLRTGHLIADLFGTEWDVFFIALAARVRDIEGDDAYLLFLRTFWNIVEAELAAPFGSYMERRNRLKLKIAPLVVSLIDKIISNDIPDIFIGAMQDYPTAQALFEFQSMREYVDLESAQKKATLLECIVLRLMIALDGMYDISGLQLIARGSFAQGIMRPESDFDFEISSSNYPNGHRPLERMLGRILSAIGIENEASEDRPMQADIRGADWTRDAIEWLEIRCIYPPQEFPWVRASVVSGVHYDRIGLYERSSFPADKKHFWLAVRTMIARAARIRSFEGEKTIEQLAFLKKSGLHAEHEKLIDVIHSILSLTTAADESEHSSYATELNNLAVALGVPSPYFLQSENN